MAIEIACRNCHLLFKVPRRRPFRRGKAKAPPDKIGAECPNCGFRNWVQINRNGRRQG